MKKIAILIASIASIYLLAWVGMFFPQFSLGPIAEVHSLAVKSQAFQRLHQASAPSIFLALSYEDANLLGLPRVSQLSDSVAIPTFFHGIELTQTNSDLATCESFLVLKDGNKVVERIGLAFEGKWGFQSPYLGWVEIENQNKFRAALEMLRPCYLPYYSL